MDISLDFEEGLNRTTASKLDTTEDQETDDMNEGQVETLSNINKGEQESADRRDLEQGGLSKENDFATGELKGEELTPGSEDKDGEKQKMEVSEEGTCDPQDPQSDPPANDQSELGPPGDPPVAVVDDTIELTSNEFENDLFGTEKPKEVEVVKEKVEEVLPKPAPKKPAAPPPKIHNRDYKIPETAPEKTKIQWDNKLVRNLISTDLLKELIDIKLSKEEENSDANLTRSRRSRHVRTTSSETKKKTAKKDDEDLDFEPESDHENEANTDIADDSRDTGGREPTAFPDPPVDPVPRSRKEENRALLITNLIRPFTVLQLKTMLSNCGKVKSIWISTIKSRCYVVFSTLEEAARARESLHGAVWPSTSPKRLIVDYAEDERMYSETDGELIGDSIDIQVIEEQKRKKPKKEKGQTEEKGTMLDDLFKKTVAVPSIYWLPLTEKQAKTRADERSKAKPRYFIPEPELESEFVKPRAIPRWRTPERTPAVGGGRAAKSPAGAGRAAKSPGGRGRSPPRPAKRGERRRR